jgi:Mn2+/Fe2+ NRAMP family transporter
MIDKFLSLMTPEILTNIGLFVAIALIGAIVSVMVGFLLNKYVSRKMAQGWFKKEVLESVEYYKKSSKLIISVLQIFILIFFLFLGAELLGFPSFSEFLGNLFKYIPIILGTIITLAFAIAIGKFLASKALNLNTEYSSVYRNRNNLCSDSNRSGIF